MDRIGCQRGDVIRRLRKERKLSVAAFAPLVGLTPQSLSNIELGNKPAGIATLVRIAGQFGVSLDEIVETRGVAA